MKRQRQQLIFDGAALSMLQIIARMIVQIEREQRPTNRAATSSAPALNHSGLLSRS
ncbi:hypothetical protein PSYMP_13329 [Pseudomonas amygdali pv. morsprunorum str. M302280]|nr:hypothetical protein PSYMP_13329 [Pseudomonas amygdali pv. morsprunorum str. M302280]